MMGERMAVECFSPDARNTPGGRSVRGFTDTDRGRIGEEDQGDHEVPHAMATWPSAASASAWGAVEVSFPRASDVPKGGNAGGVPARDRGRPTISAGRIARVSGPLNLVTALGPALRRIHTN